MEIAHRLEHFFRDRRLLKIHKELAVNLRYDEDEVFKSYTLRAARKADLKDIFVLYKKIFGVELLSFLNKIYRHCYSELISVAAADTGKIVGIDLFMFQEAELGKDILHELYVGIDPEYQHQGLAAALRAYSVKTYRLGGKLKGLSTLAPFDDIKALRTAQRAGYAITKASAKPPAYYLYQAIATKLD